jgi:hypothetical protein
VHEGNRILSVYQLRFFSAGKLVAQREVRATEPGVARVIAQNL